jgi:hypothetical protein
LLIERVNQPTISNQQSAIDNGLTDAQKADLVEFLKSL